LIDKENAPVAWAGLMYELEDAQEHLAALISKMNSAEAYDETDFRLELGHVFAHLNRAWYRRDQPDGLSDEQWMAASGFSMDFK
jgi:hypothetical protein